MGLFYGGLRNEGQLRQKFLIYPDSLKKIYWDSFIVILLLIACTIIPARLAFVNEKSLLWEAIFYTLDFFFLIDIIIMFFSV